jgi:hypothetical protein
MPRFTKTVDIWALTPEQRATLQPGQWVRAGDRMDAARGRFWGERTASTVVAWQDNAKGRGWSYHRSLRQYALGGKHHA